jgi:hypothetical protein
MTITALERILIGHCSPPEVALPTQIIRINVRTIDKKNHPKTNLTGLLILLIILFILVSRNNLSINYFIVTNRKIFYLI